MKTLRDRLAAELAARRKGETAATAVAAKAADLLKKLTAQIARLDAENSRLRDRLEGVVASREDVKAQVEALEKARKEARARAEKLETAGERAAARAAALAAEGQELKDRVAALVRQLVAIEEENKRIAALLADALAARNALGKEASELGRVRVGLDEKIKALVKKIAQLDAENRRLVQQLEAERKGGAEAEARVADLTGRQAALERERADLARQLADLRDKNAQLRANLAAALRDHNSLGKTAGALREEQGRLIARLAEVERARNRLRKLLAAAQKEGQGLGAKLGAADQQIAEMRSVSATQARQVLLLTQQLIALRRQLLSIQEALDVSEAQGKQQQLKISNLDQRLKAALVRQVNELKQYKSEFFGELRKTLGTRQDVRIVGDRFVFPSSVLFATNSSNLQDGGKAELRKLAATLKELAKKIPQEIDWILRVDGHTDVRAFKGGSNLELSARRAIAVVNFLMEEGIPPRRLFAAGFGSHHPIDPGDTEEAYRKNRRIEIRLTQR